MVGWRFNNCRGNEGEESDADKIRKASNRAFRNLEKDFVKDIREYLNGRDYPLLLEDKEIGKILGYVRAYKKDYRELINSDGANREDSKTQKFWKRLDRWDSKLYQELCAREQVYEDIGLGGLE